MFAVIELIHLSVNNISEILPNRLWKLKTSTGVFALKKLRFGNYQEPQNALQGQRIAQAFKLHQLPIVAAIENPQGFITTTPDGQYMMFPWLEGKALTHAEITIDHAYQIGKLLAQLHTAKLNLTNVTMAAWQDYQLQNWLHWLNQAKDKNLAWRHVVENYLNQLDEWSKRYGAANQQLKNDLVISHGDLTEGNVIWDAQQHPWIIDWETAGWIHPQIELFGVAINWSGVVTLNVKQSIFRAILAGYRASGQPVLINETIMHASLGSWLAWLVFNMQLSCAGINQAHANQQVTETLIVTAYLTRSFNTLLTWI